MRALRTVFVTLSSALLFAACGDDSTTPPPPLNELDKFVGTWTASAWDYSPLAGGPSVSAMPISFTMTVAPGGSCVVDQHFPQDAGPRHLTGSVTIWIAAADAGGSDENFFGTYSFTNGGKTVTMVSTDDWWWDFDFDGVQDPAKLTFVLTKVAP